MKVVCLSEQPELCEMLVPLAGAAARRLGLEDHLERAIFCLDDVSADERVWISFRRRSDATEGPRREVTIYLHPAQMLKDRPVGRDLMPGPASWENLEEIPRRGQAFDPGQLSRAKIERFLHHQLLSVRDLCDGSVLPHQVPAHQAESFQEIWSVTIDGRLRRHRLPGYPVAERRRRFNRVYSTAGVLLPEHWAIFHALWELDELEMADLLRFAARLPRLGRPRQ